MQTVTNMYIVNLAIADECFLIGIPFLMITMSISYWPFGDLMCKIYMTTTSINQFTSSIFLTIMSADRYVAVCHPITAPNLRTPFISKVVSFIAWTASAIFMIPVIMYASIIDSENTKSCNIMWPETENLNGQSAFILYTFILGFAIPLVLIFVFYYLVIRKLRTVGPKNKPKEKKKSHRKVTKLVLTVITVYVFCWLPYWLTQIALIFTPPRQCQSSITVIVFLMAGALPLFELCNESNTVRISFGQLQKVFFESVHLRGRERSERNTPLREFSVSAQAQLRALSSTTAPGSYV
ncbi:hypothetical protein WDU94_002901 [Cyamophila willieti]